MHRARLIGALLATLMPVLAHAQEASFDCLKAAAPIELLICSDPELLALDGAVGEALVAQRRGMSEAQRAAALATQRAWLDERLNRCGVPAKGEDVPLDLRWRAAPCLDEVYRARLTALGVPPQAPPVSPPAASEAGFIHPACLWTIVEEDPEAAPQGGASFPIDACARGNRHIPVSLSEEGGYSAPGASDGYYTWLSYRVIDRVEDGREAIIVWYNSGGTGVFSELYLLRKTQAPGGKDTLISGELIGGGGDRCNGGIADAKLLNPRTLQVDYRVTPQDLLSEGDEELANDNIDALPFCAVCCIGTVRRTLEVATRKETTVSATVEQMLSDEATIDEGEGENDETQRCFEAVVKKAAPKLPHTFAAVDVRALAASFAKQCLKK